MKLEQYETAEELCYQVLKLVPNSAFVYSALGTIQLQQGKAGNAVLLLNKAIELNENFPSEWINQDDIKKTKASACFYANDYNCALNSYEELLTKLPHNTEIMNLKGKTEIKLYKYKVNKNFNILRIFH